MRRLSLYLLLGLLAGISLCPATAETIYVSTAGPEGETGIFACAFENGSLAAPRRLYTTERKAEIALGKGGRLLYAAIGPDKGEDSGDLIAFAVRDDGSLAELGRLSRDVGTYCSLALSGNGRGLVAASYADGEVDSFLLDKEGAALQRSSRISLPRFTRGDRDRDLARAHDVEFHRDGRLVFATDIANQRVYSLTYLPETAELELLGHVSAEAFVGPRHLIQDRASKHLYVLSQRGSVIVAFEQKADGGLEDFQAVTTIPMDPSTINNHSAEVLLHPSEKFLYASNRGHDSLAVFARRQDGTLSREQIISSGGKSPWSFVFAGGGDFLICSNRNSDNLVVFAVDQEAGQLTPTGQVVTLAQPLKMAALP